MLYLNGGNIMITITKLENFYGIKSLRNCNLIQGNTLIYAPNGVMKSSFADGINDISNRILPKDVRTNESAIFKIVNNGQNITDQNLGSIDSIVFSHTKAKSAIYDNPDFAKLVMSEKLRQEYLEENSKIKEIKDAVLDIVKSEITKEKKGYDKTLQFLKDLTGKDSDIDLLLEFPSESQNLKPEKIAKLKELNYSDVLNNDIVTVLTEPDFVIDCKMYLSIVHNKFSSEVIVGDFTLENLITVVDVASKTSYFSTGHSLRMADTDYNKEQSQELIDQLTETIYESPEARESFLRIQKKLSKNQKTKTFNKILNNNKWLIDEIVDVNQFRINVITSKISENLDFINAKKNVLREIQKNVRSIIKSADQEKQIWEKILTTYNTRFFDNVYDIQLENTNDAILGISSPNFIKKVRGTDTVITDEIYDRFSTGEKRAILILNLLFEIEIRCKQAKDFTLILDDVADSFDYKNKYAILEYLKDLAQNPQVQIIVLTHNFDFFRSAKIITKAEIKSKCLAYKDDNGVVTLHMMKTDDLDDLNFYRNWKMYINRFNGQIDNRYMRNLISCIPFVRNISELEAVDTPKEDIDYLLLTKCLHYSKELENMTFMDINSTLKRFSISIKEELFESMFLESLWNVASTILQDKTRIKEQDLDCKIVLAIFQRIYTDKIIYDSYIEFCEKNVLEADTSLKIDHMHDLVKDNLPSCTSTLIQKAKIIAPSFVHVNSFMYEPLIDVGVTRMIELTMELMDYHEL